MVIKESGGSKDSGQTPRKAVIEKSVFSWGPGFRIGLGALTPFYGWDLAGYWTHFDQTNHRKISRSGMSPLEILAINDFKAAKALDQFKFNFNTYDLQLSRDYYISHKLVLMPAVGLRCATIDQSERLQLTDPESNGGYLPDKIHVTHNFIGGGPRLGLGSKWVFGKGWGLLGKLGVSLLGGRIKSNSKLSSDLQLPNQNLTTVNSDPFCLRANLDGFLGVDGSWCVSKRCALHFSAGYEMQYWWNQFQQPYFVALFLPGDLGLQGLTAQFRVDF